MIYVILKQKELMHINEKIYSKTFPIAALKSTKEYCEILLFQDTQKEGLEFINDLLEVSEEDSTVDSAIRILRERSLFVIPIPQS